MKVCNICGYTKSLDAFYAMRNACKVCIIARVKEYRENNKTKVKAQQANTFTRNREKRIVSIRAWQAANSERYKESVRRGVLHRIARKRAAEGKYSAADIRTIGERQTWRCANPYCHCDLSTGYHVDHSVSLARGGSNWPSNIQLLCAPCNQRKGAKNMDEFLQTLEQTPCHY